tara:strand:- start:383 stop:499 length:117 start_codon:yes stop_codon:yes gene_type:complete
LGFTLWARLDSGDQMFDLEFFAESETGLITIQINAAQG